MTTKPLFIISLVLFIGVGLIVYAKTTSTARGPYPFADTLPRGALVYAQFRICRRSSSNGTSQRSSSNTSPAQTSSSFSIGISR